MVQFSVSVSGGVMPYTFDWLGYNETSNTLSDLPEGNYTLIVTDSNDCQESIQIPLVNSPEINWTFDFKDQTCEGAADGMISVDAQGGTGILIYQWEHGPSTNSIDLLVAGSYCITVTDENNCSIDTCFIITEPDGILIQGLIQDAKCHADSSGAISLSVINAQDPIILNWTGPAAFSAVDSEIDELIAGLYTVTVTDNKGCSSVEEFIVNQPESINAILTGYQPSCNGFNDGSTELNVSGGSEPYLYQWSNGSNESNANDLSAGITTVTITDANGCTSIDQIEIDEPEPLYAEAEVEEPGCFGAADGEIHLNVSGGTGPYLYSINGINFSGSEIIPGIAAGTYDVIIVDNNECQIEVSGVEVGEPTPVIIDLGENLEIQKGETIILKDILDISPDLVKFKWSSPDSASISCLDCHETAVNPSFSTWYTLIVEDINGCIGEDGIYVNVITQYIIAVADMFTPNGDGINDILPVQGSPDLIIEEFSLYNRWGDRVYYTESIPINDNSNGWDGRFKGKKAESGIYVWVVKARFPDGHVDYFKGQTTLLNK